MTVALAEQPKGWPFSLWAVFLPPSALPLRCAALMSMLLETDDSETCTALCERLLHGLRQLRELCDADLPPYLVTQLIVGEKVTSCVPECWQETALQVDYAQALTQALLAGMLPPGVAKELTGLLHDMVWLLAEFVKEPYIATH
ncbi:hypothetical protein GNG27_13585 [Leclercia sp. 119287]|nr:hypothetical protein GNG27_13585 [Leclercia sp. 119287]